MCAGYLKEIVHEQSSKTLITMLKERNWRKSSQEPEDAEKLESAINELAVLKNKESSTGSSNRAFPSLSRSDEEEEEEETERVAPEITVQCTRRARPTGSDSRGCKASSTIDQIRQNKYKCINSQCRFDMRKAAKEAVEGRI